MALAEIVWLEYVVVGSVSVVMVGVDIGFEAATRELNVKSVPARCWSSPLLVPVQLLLTSASVCRVE